MNDLLESAESLWPDFTARQLGQILKDLLSVVKQARPPRSLLDERSQANLLCVACVTRRIGQLRRIQGFDQASNRWIRRADRLRRVALARVDDQALLLESRSEVWSLREFLWEFLSAERERPDSDIYMHRVSPSEELRHVRIAVWHLNSELAAARAIVGVNYLRREELSKAARWFRRAETTLLRRSPTLYRELAGLRLARATLAQAAGTLPAARHCLEKAAQAFETQAIEFPPDADSWTEAARVRLTLLGLLALLGPQVPAEERRSQLLRTLQAVANAHVEGASDSANLPDLASRAVAIVLGEAGRGEAGNASHFRSLASLRMFITHEFTGDGS